ncbi:hypothetical protein PR048_023683 [Dryococelus australis]|uniref:Uncharacterized protein n=1 Tax=Dryococelus australis TaxID=614101 RepID=A0ABQ9GUZ4_9NEOP|nr:hypothetical protein PR048_023683 [Dryococelus australis]
MSTMIGVGAYMADTMIAGRCLCNMIRTLPTKEGFELNIKVQEQANCAFEYLQAIRRNHISEATLAREELKHFFSSAGGWNCKLPVTVENDGYMCSGIILLRHDLRYGRKERKSCGFLIADGLIGHLNKLCRIRPICDFLPYQLATRSAVMLCLEFHGVSHQFLSELGLKNNFRLIRSESFPKSKYFATRHTNRFVKCTQPLLSYDHLLPKILDSKLHLPLSMAILKRAVFSPCSNATPPNPEVRHLVIVKADSDFSRLQRYVFLENRLYEASESKMATLWLGALWYRLFRQAKQNMLIDRNIRVLKLTVSRKHKMVPSQINLPDEHPSSGPHINLNYPMENAHCENSL